MARTIFGKSALLATVALGVAAGSGRPAEAAFVLTFLEVGPDVVGTGTGSLNTTGLTYFVSSPVAAIMQPSFALVRTTGDTDRYAGASGPTSFGPGGATVPSSISGDVVSLQGINGGVIGVPAGYTQDAPLSMSMTFAGATFASLGMTQGTYVWTWGREETADSFTVQIGPVGVPEPASALLLGAGLLGLGLARRRRA